MQQNKSRFISSIKSNRSQASSTSTASEQKRHSSHLGSPIESPLHSPGSAAAAAAAASAWSTHSPGYFANDNDVSSQDEGLTRRIPEPGSPYNQPQGQGPIQGLAVTSLRRSRSQRSSTPNPTVPGELVAPGDNQAGPISTNAYSSNSWRDGSSKGEPKKGKRFFLFGDLSTSKSSSTGQKQPARRLSKRNRAPPLQPPRLVTASDGQSSQLSPPSSSQFSSPTLNEDSEAEFVTQDSHRPIISIPTAIATAPSDRSPSPEEYSSLSNRDYAQSQSESTQFTTASGQSQPSEQGGSQKTGARGIGRAPPHHRVPSDQPPTLAVHSKNRVDLNIPDPSFSNSRPPSRQSLEPPSPSYVQHGSFHRRTSSGQNSALAESSMGPSNNQQHSNARSLEATSSQSGSTREGQYGSTLSVNNQQGVNYRNTPQASPMAQENSGSEPRRTTPPPARSRDDLQGLDVQQLSAKYEELNDKYRKVKKYYFDKDAQVQQLQDTLAHQRLAQSRTSLDDNEYATRFSRLDGAINNLAFNIRKDWRAVPPWLAAYVNKDATNTVTKEMTAVGRACISRWLVDELFDRFFHPALDLNLSTYLKAIERNLRRFAPPANTDEERKALLAKISNWRLSCLDGLSEMLNSHEAVENRSSLTKSLVDMLTQDLMLNLKDPQPAGLEAGVVGIIELAVGISANLPLESRDVYVDYIMPGTLVNESFMKIEGALPALTNPGEGHIEPDRSSVGSLDDKEDDDQSKDQAQGKVRGMFTSLMGGERRSRQPGRGNQAESQPAPPKEDRVRFAAFMSVEVKGKAMLVKAPVYV